MRPGQDVWEKIINVRCTIDRYLKDVPNSCFRFEDNKALFILLTLKRDPKWHYRVDELHPRLYHYRLWGKCC